MSVTQFSIDWEERVAEVVVLREGSESAVIVESEVFFHQGKLTMPYLGREHRSENALPKNLLYGHHWKLPVPKGVSQATADLWIVGRIVYSDPDRPTTHHNLIFARCYNRADGRFYPDFSDPDYNLST